MSLLALNLEASKRLSRRQTKAETNHGALVACMIVIAAVPPPVPSTMLSRIARTGPTAGLATPACPNENGVVTAVAAVNAG